MSHYMWSKKVRLTKSVTTTLTPNPSFEEGEAKLLRMLEDKSKHCNKQGATVTGKEGIL